MPDSLHRLAHQHRVEPAAAPAPAGHGAELAAALAEAASPTSSSSSVGKGPSADTRGVGLGDAQHIADRARAEAGADPRLRRPPCWTRSRRDRCRGRCRAWCPARPRTGCACPRAPHASSSSDPHIGIGEGQDLGRDVRSASWQSACRAVDRRPAHAAAQRDCGGPAASVTLAPRWRGRRDRRPGWRGGRPCPRRQGRCRGRWCRS